MSYPMFIIVNGTSKKVYSACLCQTEILNPLVLSLTIWTRCAHASEQWSEDEPRSLTVVESRHMDGISYKEDSDTSVLSDEDG